MRWLALHGLPLGPPAWERIRFDLDVHAFEGLVDGPARADSSLSSLVAEVEPRVDARTVLVGHDLGGLVAANLARTVRVRALVLTGTALGSWWWGPRLAALPVLRRAAYDRFGGSFFLARGVRPAVRAEFTARMGPELTRVPDLADRMVRVARGIRPSPFLIRKVRSRVPVHLIWGRHDRFYPPALAKNLARRLRAPIHWIDAGHYAMWEEAGQFDDALATIAATLRR